MALTRIIEIIKDYDDVLVEIDNFFEFYNIIKFIQIERFKVRIENEVQIDIKNFIKQIESKLGKFISQRTDKYLELYESVDFLYHRDFFEVMDKYKVYKSISGDDLREFMTKYRTTLYYILENKNIVLYHDEVIKTTFLDNPNNAEIVLDKYLSEKNLNLPSLSLYQIECLIDNYLELEHLNINHLRKIIFFPLDVGLVLNDKLKLKAKRRLKQEEERITKGRVGHKMGAEISYSEVQEEVVQRRIDGGIVKYSIQKQWITDNLDFNTLWNNFIYVFHFFDEQSRLNLVSKINEAGVFERAFFWNNGKHIYKAHAAFKINEMCSSLQMVSYSELLNLNGIRIEDMIEWFFIEYIKDEFDIIKFIVKMPSERLSYFEKCRTILPEIDRILKQYNTFIENGEIDHELLQMSSKPMAFGEYLSNVKNKYIYPESIYYYNAVNRLFSDQSGLTYIPKSDKNHKNLCELLLKEKVRMSDLEQHQKDEIKWLIDNDLLEVDEKEYITIKDITGVTVLGDLFLNEVISYWNQPLKIKQKIDEWILAGILKDESSLLSKSEQDYMDFYLNKKKFTNGHDLRNRYAHGTHSNDEKQHQLDYIVFLKVIIILVIKINDDLCCFEKSSVIEM